MTQRTVPTKIRQISAELLGVIVQFTSRFSHRHQNPLRKFGKFLLSYSESLSSLLVVTVTAIKTFNITNVYVVLMMTVMMVMITDDYDETHMCIGAPF
jgi:hypothetical protein